jgi:integrase
VDDGVDHCFPQRLIGILRLVLAVEAADRRADTDVPLEERGRLIDELRQRATDVLAIDIATDAEGIGILDTDDLALGELELRVIAEHQQARIRGPGGTVFRVVRGSFKPQQQIDGRTVPSPFTAAFRTEVQVALEVAVRNNYIVRNVASRTELPPVPKPDIHPLNVHQALALLAMVAGHRWAALYRLAINLGMREGELLGLTWPAIDFERGTIRIFQQLRRAKVTDDADAGREFILQATKTKAGERTLTLDDDLLQVLRAYQAHQAEEQTVLGEKWKDPWGTLVFTSETGAPIHASCLLDHFRGALWAANLPRIRFHDLRHTAATLMLANGVPLVTVSKILGHSSPAVTAQIYAHALDESKAEAIAALSQQLRRDGAPITHTITHTPPKTHPAPHTSKRGIPHRDAGAGDGTRTRTGLPPTVFKALFRPGPTWTDAALPH